MKTWRPHRFPPLSLAAESRLPAPGYAAVDNQAALADGFQQGMERGYREGYDSGRAQAHADGFAQGLREGQSQGQASGHAEALVRWDRLAAPVDAALAELRRVQDDYQQALRRELIDLVAKVARQVIRCELTLQPLQLLKLVEETLAGMPPASSGVEVLLNPMDLERIRDLDPQRASQWALLADARLDVGECLVRCGGHEADAGCRQRLAACMEQISAQVLGSGEAAPVAQEAWAAPVQDVQPTAVPPAWTPEPQPAFEPAPGFQPQPQPWVQEAPPPPAWTPEPPPAWAPQEGQA